MEPLIEIREIVKRYGEKIALDRLSLTVPSGQIFGIIGESGAGKSTLFRCLSGLEKIDAGTLVFDGQKVEGTAFRTLQKEIGFVFQHFNLFSGRNAWQNVAFPLEIRSLGERKKRAYALLERVGLKGKEELPPARLSGGEKQRVAIARALVCEPRLLFCDEATSALDPTTTASILELLSSLNREEGLSILLITHEMEVIKQICHRVAVLERGQIVEEGEVMQLFTRPQNETTKRFLASLEHALPKGFTSAPDQKLFSLRFSDVSAKRPLITEVVRNFSVEVNILLGGIDQLQSGIVGNLVIGLEGESQERQAALDYLQKAGVEVEEVV